jgi:hypothetical protein
MTCCATYQIATSAAMRRHALHEEDALVDAVCAVQRGDDHAVQEEQHDLAIAGQMA